MLANLKAWGAGRCIFLITHRLSTIRRADTVAYLRDGQVGEIGMHDTLMARPDGAYRRFFNAESADSNTPAEVEDG